MSGYYQHHHHHPPIKTEPVSPDEDLFAVYLKDLMIGDPCGGLSNAIPRRATSEPYCEITEQPKQRDHRFRYPVEGRQAGSIAGEKSTSDLPSYPTIKVANLSGRAKVVVSLVTKNDPPLPHPHRLVGDGCRDGVCTRMIDPQRPEVVFHKIGVQRTMNKEVENSLEERKRAGVKLSMVVNKGKTGKKHNYEMKAVRLFFEVYIETIESSGVFDKYLTPVTSTAVYDKKDTVLSICRVNISTGSVEGGDELFILCEKVQSDDIKVKFYGHDAEKNQPWEAFGEFSPSDVHRQFAIVCKTPRFVNQNIKTAVTVQFHLYRPSDDESSREMPFIYKPRESVHGFRDIEKKKRKLSHKGPEEYNKFFTSSGQPFKTETLGASSQSCSGAPLGQPVSNAQSTLTPTPVTMAMASSDTRRSLRQHLMRGDQTLGVSEPQPTLLGNVIYAGGTAQIQQDRNLPLTFTSEAHMSSGTMIQQPQQPQQPQHQPVSTDQGTLDIPAQAFLISLATNEEMEQDPQDEERTTSLQRINAIANELMSSVEATGGAVGGNERVIVQSVPHPNILSDLTYSNLDTVDIAAFQDVTATINDDLVYSAYNDSVMDMNNTSNSNNNNNNPMG
ncbi:putative transcription factor p65 homolog isoform X2 [Strongylocentrotus purpuratus]|uniref:RHD domain-containing protein n=1 Tax=Strongylocentrotus purpuratus TaxID=7668 RepID=A0A7M7REC8_STRPU|nr:putative transcription factor p65 homolog isoform X2 [Strongylocentrotus purpuratus]|eukprot:XP_780741.2 PREDICTED: putative transcription factor p65 homolog [Strongylocentrotus purpuratus]